MRQSGAEAPARERQVLLLHPDRRQLAGDGSDLWNLERTVEELEQRLLHLEERPCPCPNASAQKASPPAGVEAKLQAEVMWLKRGLEEHLRVFKNIFSNADVLARSDATLELDKLWQLLKKREKKSGGGRAGVGSGGHQRNRRDLGESGLHPRPCVFLFSPLILFFLLGFLSPQLSPIWKPPCRSWLGHL